jgi:hypothetical protein
MGGARCPPAWRHTPIKLNTSDTYATPISFHPAKAFALKSCIDANFVEEGIKVGSNPENNVPEGLIDVADTDDISTGPARILSVSTTTVHPLLIQDGG